MTVQAPSADRRRLAWPRAAAAILALALVGWAGLLMALNRQL